MGNVILDKSKSFALRIIKLYQYLCAEKRECILSKQVLRSGTSIGANVKEASACKELIKILSAITKTQKAVSRKNNWIES